MSRSPFIERFDYDSTTNRRVLDHLRALPTVSEYATDVFAHLLTAKGLWLKRLRGRDTSDITLWSTLSFDECGVLIDENAQAYDAYLRGKTEAELAAEVRYKNSKGIEFENAVRDILMHVLIHGGHHRGQIARAVRESGETPINTGYIFHVREPVAEER